MNVIKVMSTVSEMNVINIMTNTKQLVANVMTTMSTIGIMTTTTIINMKQHVKKVLLVLVMISTIQQLVKQKQQQLARQKQQLAKRNLHTEDKDTITQKMISLPYQIPGGLLLLE